MLGVEPSASPAEIKQAYRRQARAHHPDTAGAGSATMQALNEAWSVLGDPARLIHDRSHPSLGGPDLGANPATGVAVGAEFIGGSQFSIPRGPTG